MINMVKSAETFAGNFTKVILSAVNGALKGLNWFVEKANDLLGTSIPTAKLFDENNVHAVSDSLQNMMNAIPVPTSNKAIVSIPRMEQRNIADYAKTGYSKGYSATDRALKSMNNLLNINKQSDITGQGAYNLGGNNTIPDIGKVGKVGKIEDKVDIASEDLKLMRELAEMKTIQNFTTLTPNIQFHGGVNVRDDDDIDRIAARIKTVIVNDLEQEIASSASGVFLT